MGDPQLETLLAGLHATPPSPLPFMAGVDLRSFVLDTEQGPVVIYNTPGIDKAQEEITSRGIPGSSDIRWGSWGESAGGEEHAEPVVVAVAEAAGEAAVQFDDPVHGLSAAVR